MVARGDPHRKRSTFQIEWSPESYFMSEKEAHHDSSDG
jgi:hypothetical protein